MELLLLAVGVIVLVRLTSDDAPSSTDADNADGFRVDTLDPVWWASNTADRLDLDNRPDAGSVDNLLRLRDTLDAVFPQGYRVTNAYRTPALNAALRDAGYGAAPHSYHLSGRAADVDVNGMSPYEAAKVALQSGRFVEVIPYTDGHLHVAIL